MERILLKDKTIELMKIIDQLFSENGIWYILSYGSALGAVREHGFIEWDGDIDLIIKHTDQIKARELLKKNLPSDYIVVSCDKETISFCDEIDIKGVSADEMHIDLYTLVGAPNDPKDAYRWQKRCRRIHRLFSCKYLKFDRLTSRIKIPAVLVIRAFEYLLPDSFFRRCVTRLANKYPFEKNNCYLPFPSDGKKGEYVKGDWIFDTVRLPFENVMLPVPQDYDKYLTCIYGNDYMTPIKY